MDNTNIITEASAVPVASKTPSTFSSCDTARVVSRKLGKAGFEMSKKIDNWSRSKGFMVRRLGCSSTVYVDYWNYAWVHNPSGSSCDSELKFNREKMQSVLKFLRGIGYQIDDKGYIQCEKSY